MLEFSYLRDSFRIAQGAAFDRFGRRCTGPMSSPEELRAVLESNSIREMPIPIDKAEQNQTTPKTSLDLVGTISVDTARYDIVVVEQGYGGVFVNTIGLLRELSKYYKCLLISPVPPLFDDEVTFDVLTPSNFTRFDPAAHHLVSYFSILRGLVRHLDYDLLIVAHRSQSIYIFDLIADRKAVVYCDGYYDGALHAGELTSKPISNDEVISLLEVILESAAGSPEGFFGLSGSPGTTAPLLRACALALGAATENWCWGAKQLTDFSRAFPSLKGDALRLELPFLNHEITEIRAPADAKTWDILFTTTMHNIEKKGFPELLQVLAALPNTTCLCVVRQPDRLPPIPSEVKDRIFVCTLSKRQMVEAYKSVLLNFRVSREESSPLSILESMLCGVPQVLSDVVAHQIPQVVHGKTAMVSPPDDIDSQIAAVKTLISDLELRKRMSRAASAAATELCACLRMGHFHELIRL